VREFFLPGGSSFRNLFCDDAKGWRVASSPSKVRMPDIVRIDRLKIFLDSMGGGAWPFLVGGVICLVNSVNERDLNLLNSLANSSGFV
jgi:hypothetical protein